MPGADVKYQFEVDLQDRNNGHSLLHALVVDIGKHAMDVLEVGCSSGYVGATLVAKGHRVTGVELDREAAEAAAAALDEVHNGDIDQFFDAHPDRRYDAILLGDVLEHLVDPAATLRRCAAHLAADGAVAISLPCITHGSIRAMLLDGHWDYADYGLLDRTHLHFFSRQGMAELVAAGGLEITRLLGTVMPIETAAREYGMTLRPQSIAAVESLSMDDAELLVFQFVFLARPPRDATTTAALLARNLAMPLELAVPPPLPRGRRSILQGLRVQALKALLRGITRRRFRGTPA